MSRFAVILPAAGKSSRMKGFSQRKPFIDLKGRPIWIRTVEHFIHRKDVAEVILVVAPENMDWFREKFIANLALLDIQVVEGGASRSASVCNGLRAIRSDPEFVAVHDAARPLLTEKWIDRIFAAAIEHDAVIPGLSVHSTVKEINESRVVQRTVDRSHLVLAQTPQVFRTALLRSAFENPGDGEFTDEASMIEAGGTPVHVVDGWAMNIKITTAEDHQMAEALLEALPRPDLMRDLHPFADERFL